MHEGASGRPGPDEADETHDWLESLDAVVEASGVDRARRLMRDLQLRAFQRGVRLPFTATTPYINTIPADAQPVYPGDRDLERRIKSIIRWNAMAMVVRANHRSPGIGGHISTYQSAATLYEVAYNHFLRGGDDGRQPDLVYFQGHASPGNYARSFLEGRLTEAQLENFRRELAPGGGLSSYPHPWLMPEYWSFPTVSMGLGPIMAIYQARFCRYLEDRGLKPRDGMKVWAFVGDGETDEPEALGALHLAAQEGLDNLIFVVNCNLQRLDGPVRGNGKIIQELEGDFRGAGWNVIKVIWGGTWDALLAADTDGLLVKRMTETVDGWYQKYVVSTGAFLRDHFFGVDPRLRKMVDHLSDDDLRKMRRGGHDPEKVFAAYKAAVEHEGSPTVILAKTIKGYGLGEAGEGRNVTHQQKKLSEDELRRFRDRFGIPVPDDRLAETPFYRPPDESPEMRYLHERRRALGGYLPARRVRAAPLPAPEAKAFAEVLAGSGGREASTTMAFVRLLARLLKDPNLGPRIVPIVPDEARTFGMEALFRQCGIYAHPGQLYEPVDSESLLYYKEAVDGQILEEGICEAGALASFIAAGTACTNYGAAMIPFFAFYSMFGFQRVGDLIWAAADSRSRGFLIGATSGRTTLAGEGLQHQDGQSHVHALGVPNLRAYDPAYAYEVAVVVEDGIRRMFTDREEIFYYVTVANEAYAQPPMPEGAREGILRGMHRVRAADPAAPRRVRLLGSGAILLEALRAAEILGTRGVAAEVWSVTSYKALRDDALRTDRWNRLHPAEAPRRPYAAECLGAESGDGVVVAASDYLRVLPDSLARYVPGDFVTLGTEGFGRSDDRSALRDHFGVDARHIALAALSALARRGEIPAVEAEAARRDLGIDPAKPDPVDA